MFVKTLNGQEYFDASQQEALNWGINDSINSVIKRNPDFTGINKGQVIFTNCMTRENKEVNAMISFEYSYENGKTNYFRLIEIAIFDNDDDAGVNYMLEHRISEDALGSPDDPIEGFIEAMSEPQRTDTGIPKLVPKDPYILSARFREEFNRIGRDYITGFDALKIVLKILKEE